MANLLNKRFLLDAGACVMTALLLHCGSGASIAAEELPPFEEPGGAYSLVAPGDAGSFHNGGLEPIPAPLTDDLTLHCDAPAVTESSGTWLRRGLWYADLEGVVMNRTWDSAGIRFAIEIPAPPNNFIFSQTHTIGESSPGAEGNARLTLGRFLFRDLKNRDHNAEMLIFGGGEWNEEFTLAARDDNTLPNGGLLVPGTLTSSNTLPNFSQADEMDLIYSSRLTNWEWNYSVTERLRRDRMELLPSGKWVRRAAPGMTQEYLVGLRFVDLQENIDWAARDIISLNPAGGADGMYSVRTSNNLFGLQLGYGITYDTDRWNVSISTKQGFLVADERVTGNLIATGSTDNVDFATVAHENRLSYLAQVSILTRYHLRPNLSLRCGWEMMYLTNLALAPNQLNFSPVPLQVSATGDAVYHGFTAGTEYYW